MLLRNSLVLGVLLIEAVASTVLSLSTTGEIDYGPKVSEVIKYITGRGYDKRVRPNYKGNTVSVNASMYITDAKFNTETHNEVTFDLFFRQHWVDQRLAFGMVWDEEIKMGGEVLQEIWRPDSFFLNSKNTKFHHVPMPNSFARIKPNGNVTQSLRLTVTANCPISLRYFPIGTQICFLEVESYGYAAKDVAYNWAKAPAESVNFASDLTTRIRSHREGTRIVDIGTANFSRIFVEFEFERPLCHYLIQVYLPSVLVVIISLASFWLDHESAPARVSLGIVTCLLMVLILVNTNASLPKTQYLKAIDVYLLTCLEFVVAAVIEYIAVNHKTTQCKTQCSPRRHSQQQRLLIQTQAGDESTVVEDVVVNGVPHACSNIDKVSRVLFPVFFGIFNVLYWVGYWFLSTSPDLERLVFQ